MGKDYKSSKQLIVSTARKLQKKIFLAAFLFTAGIGLILRTFGYSDLLIFKSDQARDAFLMQSVLTGEQSLPLLGASIGGEDFYLGPASYYFQYISAKLLSPFFHPTPEIFALPELIFGLLSIPLMYLLARKFFPPGISLWLMAMISFSPLFVTFSRFAWNPNSLPFFTIVFLLSFTSAIRSTRWTRIFFLFVSSFCVGIIAQLHFLALLGISLGIIFYLILYRPLKFIEVFLCVLIFFCANTPMIIHEIRTQGKNMEGMIGITQTSNVRSDEKKLTEKIFRSFQENARGMWLVSTGKQNTDIVGTSGASIKCDKKCRSALPITIASWMLFGVIVGSFMLVWRKQKQDPKKKYIGLIGLWTIAFGLCTILLAYDLTLRYFLAIAPSFLILLGYCLQAFINGKIAVVKYLGIAAALGMLCIQLATTVEFLYDLSIADYSNAQTKRDLRFGTESKVTLGQLRAIAKEADLYFDNDAPIVITGEVKYSKALYYVVAHELERKGCFYRIDREYKSPHYNTLRIEYTDKQVGTYNADKSNAHGTLSVFYTKENAVTRTLDLPDGCLQ